MPKCCVLFQKSSFYEVYTSTSALQKVRKMLMMMSVPEFEPRPKRKNTSIQRRKWFRKIVGPLLEKLQRILEYQSAHAM